MNTAHPTEARHLASKTLAEGSVATQVSVKTVCITLCFLLAKGIHCLAAQPPEPTRTLTWAILSSEEARDTGIPALLAAELSNAKEIQLVERDATQAVLGEVELAAISGVTAIEKRIQLGSRVAANVLLILDVVEVDQFDWGRNHTSGKKSSQSKMPIATAKRLRMVVCDSRSGARLSTRSFALGRHTLIETTNRITTAIHVIREKLARGVRFIVGVSPLISKDLTHEFDTYQESLAGLIESALMAQPGIAVIAQSEAEAIWNELASQKDSEIRRFVPLLIEGHYNVQRATGAGPPLFTIHISGRYSDKTVRHAKAKAVPPKELLSCMHNLAQQLFKEPPTDTKTNFAPEEQAQWLAQQADNFSRLGAWKPAISLRQAALLLEPNHVQLRMSLISDQRMLLRQLRSTGSKQMNWPGRIGSVARAQRLLAIFYDQLKNEEYLIRNRLVDKDQALRLLASRGYAKHQSGIKESEGKSNTEVQTLLSEAEQKRKEFFFNIAPTLFQLPDSPDFPKKYSALCRMSDLQSALLNRLAWRMDYRNPSRQDLDNLLRVWTQRIPDGLGIDGILGRICYQVFPQANQIGKKDRYYQRAYSRQTLSPDEWSNFLERLSYSEHKTARIAARIERLKWEWYLFDQNSNTKKVRYMLDRADSILYELEDYPNVDSRGRRFFASGNPVRLAKDLQWLIFRHSVMLDPFGPRRQLRPKLAKQRPKHIRANDGPNKSVKRVWFEPLAFQVNLPPTGHLQLRNAHPKLAKSYRFINGNQFQPHLHWLACGEQTDIAWSALHLYFMRTPGKLEKLEFPVDHDVVVDDVRWDGNSLWVATLASGIWVLDSDLKVIHHIDATQGLPPSEHAIRTLPLGDGRACVVGSFGANYRAWCALIDTNASEPSVKVFHEAKQVARPPGSLVVGKDNYGVRSSTKQAFIPYLLLPHANDGHYTQIYVGRCRSGTSQPDVPLVIDLNDLTVSIGSASPPRPYNRIHPSLPRENEFLSFAGRNFHLTEIHLLLDEVKRSSAGNSTKTGSANQALSARHRSYDSLSPETGVAFVQLGKQLHIPTRNGSISNWIQVDLTTGRASYLEKNIRQAKRLSFAKSAHYGMIAWEFGVRRLFKVHISKSSETSPTSLSGKFKNRETRPEKIASKQTARNRSDVLPTAEQIMKIKESVRQFYEKKYHSLDDASVIYTRGIAMFDGWLPRLNIHGSYLDPPPKKEGYKYYIKNGRIAKVVSLNRDQSTVRVWFNASGAPVLSVQENIDTKTGFLVPTNYAWGSYDKRGLLAKVIHFDRNLTIKRISRLDHSDNYQSVKQIEYGPDGQFRHISAERYPVDSQSNPILAGEKRQIAYSHRLEKIKEPTRVGLEPYYPIP